MSNNKSLTIGLFGYGSFGKLIAQNLNNHARLLIYHPSGSAKEKLPANCYRGSVKEVASCQIVVLAVNLSRLKKLLRKISPYIQPNALVCDVTSVKVEPVKLMKKYLPKNAQILATHPLFGPQSAAKTLRGQTIIITPIRVKNLPVIKAFLGAKLQLTIKEMGPAEHDKKMALIHGLTFFMARGLLKMRLPQDGLNTPSYQKLLALAELERHHSPELFKTIEAGNPYAAAVRKKFIKNLEQLDKRTSR